ncbi:peptidoglycan D,D-transpeptidase FtsI family protein [Thiothrix subterranea]|uniref:Peptidoglycan D,D-transpeptidase FtsI n=1 Tax=Thiothrix subterranea TaxID=2735563 RepID=A0AA51MN08_9GAMM|nr:penicillin-binding protein 2 [Thiothrix subterranea]MDQ5767824.1 penicillin-binding protein 2 [Thiothrix subterranea]WML86714.1 penicillin-binding protein 2 [Thiothrix subterranea]
MRRKALKSPVFQGRRLFLMLALLIVIGVLMLRAAWLEIFQQEWLQQQADKRQMRVVTVPAYRGMITDRNGDPMAISSPVSSLWCNPQELLQAREELRREYELSRQLTDATVGDNAAEEREAQELATTRFARLESGFRQIEKELGLEEGSLPAKLKEASSKQFYYLGRQLPLEVADTILALDLPGVAATREYRRYYPLAETAGHVVGMTNVDGNGIEGIEKARNELLAGKNGQTRVVRDAKGKLVESVISMEEMQPGQDIQLSIDRRIQYLAYKELKTQVSLLNAKAGSVVVLDAHTGEILAMANVPSFNPNNRKELEPYLYRNRAVTDKSEPGSTLKPLTIAAALEARVLGADVEINTSPGEIKFGKYSVKDPKDYGSITLSTLLARSSNVGASRVALLMNARDQWMFLSRLGFGQAPNAGFSGETAGLLTNYTQWSKVDRASHGYGYGLSSSLLQLTHAYAPFAANGVLMPTSINKLDKPGLGQQVMAPETARAVLGMMEAVVQKGGTGEKAMVDGYRIAGKTGTAYKYIDNKYQNDRYLTSFIGVAPASRPRLVVAVQIDEPKIDDSGGRAAAPVFSKVMAEALRLLDVPPDNLPDPRQAVQQAPIPVSAPANSAGGAT